MSLSNDLSASNVFNVSGSIALVTGGGTGIGLMISQALATNGAKVYIASRRKEVVEKVCEEWETTAAKGQLIPLELDVTDKESIKKAVATIETAEGKLNILVNNAGKVGPISPFFGDPSSTLQGSSSAMGQALFDNETFDGWADLFTTNVTPVFFMTMAFLGLLQKASNGPQQQSACVINIGSISGLMKLSQNHFAYNTAKAAVHHLTKILATEFALKGYPIRVNAIAPGAFPSEMTPFQEKEWTREQIQRVTKSLVELPAGRVGSDQDMAAAVLFLASRGGSYVNGQVIVPDGGFGAVNPSIV